MPNSAPTLRGLATSLTVAEGDPPQRLDADVTFDDDEGNFDGGLLTVSGLLAEDRVAILSEGSGPGEIGVSGANVTYGGTVIGSFTGGAGTTLTVTLNAAATSAAVDALIEHLTYANVSDTPAATRTLTLDVVDAAGAHMAAAPTFAELTGHDNPLATGLPVLGTAPALAFVDVDHDGALDIVVGDDSGALRYFHHQGSGYAEISGAANPFNGFTAGSYSTPAVIDIDGDGDMDLVVGGNDGTLSAFRNDGNGSWTQLSGAGVNPFSGIDVGTFSNPAGIDIDGDGDMDLIVGNGNNTHFLAVFRQNADHSFTPVFGAANPFNGVDVGIFASPAAGDIDRDGDADLVVGNADGTIQVFRNDAGAFTPLTGADNPFDGLDVGSFSLPVLVDIDGDGDADLAVADSFGGDVRVFENRTPASIGALSVTVTAVNDAPTATITPGGGAYQAVEQAALSLKGGLVVADADGGSGIEAATVSVNYGLLHLAAGTSGATVTNNDSGAVTITGTIAQINALLSTDGTSVVTYTANSDAPPDSATLTLAIDDNGNSGSGGALTGSDSATIAIAGVNDAPFIDLDSCDSPATGTTLTYGEGQAPVVIAPSAIVSDPDQPADFGGYTLTIAFTANGTADDQLSIINQGFGPGEIVTFGSDIYYGGVLVGTFTGGDNGAPLTIAFNSNACGCSLEAIAADIAYSNISGDPSTLDRSVTFTVDDGAGANSTASAVATIHVVANDPPILTGLDASVTFAEHLVNASPQLLDPTVTLTDTEGNFDGGTLTVTGLLFEDHVAVRNEGSGAGQVHVAGSDISYGGTLIGSFTGGDGDSFVVTFNADATAASVQAVIANLTYANDSDAPTASRGLVINVTDSFGADLGVAPSAAGLPHFDALWGTADPFHGLHVDGFAAPVFVDADGDGDMDLLVGDAYGELILFKNDHGTFTQAAPADNPFSGLAVSDVARPAFVDVDGDGDLDLVVGGQDGTLQLFENVNGVFTERTGVENPFDAIQVDLAAAPTFVDLDGDGDMDLVVGDYYGTVHTFENDNGVFTELTGAANPFDGIQAYLGTPAFVDLDGDGDMDLVLGDVSGVRAFRNDGGTFTLLTGADDPFAGVHGPYAAPAFADLDGDGDFDLVVGNYFGALTTFENTPPHGQTIVVNVTPENDAPLLDLDYRDTPQVGTSASFTENDAPLTIAPFAVFADPDQPANYGGYVVTIAFTANGDTADTLSIANLGSGANQIAVSGSDVVYEGVVVGSFTGGTNGAPLVVTFNSLACACSVELTLENILFANVSDTPSGLTRTVTFTLDDGHSGTVSADAAIAVTPVEDPTVARDDAVSTTDAAVKTGSVFADNGSGADSDPDGPALQVSEVNGSAADVGSTITLASGAKLTLLADGSYSYDPNGVFNYLVVAGSGAADFSATDSFTYTLAGGNSATVTVTINGTEGAGDVYKGDAGDNFIISGGNNDVFDLSQGGTDFVAGNGGNDYFFFGASFTAADRVNGGAGTDVVGLCGTYNMVLGADNLVGIERLTLFSGTLIGGPHVTYTLTSVDANVAAGQTLTVLGAGLLSDETMIFNGAAETDGHFYIGGGAANDILVGGQQSDAIVGGAGDDQLYGLGGNDYLVGGAGADTLRGGFGADLFVYKSVGDSTATSMDHILDFQDTLDKIDLSLIDADSNVAGDQAFTFIGANAFDGTAGELRAFQSAGHWFVEADTNGDMNADLVIQVETFNHALAKSDFVL